MYIERIIRGASNSQTLLLMYWTLNSDKISKISRNAKYCARDADFVFLDFTTQIHTCFHIIIDMYFKLFLLLAFVWVRQIEQGLFSKPPVISEVVLELLAISVSGDCFAPFHASHGCCKLILWRQKQRNRKSHSGLKRLKSRLFHICLWFFLLLDDLCCTRSLFDENLASCSWACYHSHEIDRMRSREQSYCNQRPFL